MTYNMQAFIIFLLVCFCCVATPSRAGIDLYKDGEQSLNAGLLFRADIHDGQGKDDGEAEFSSIEVHVQAQFTRWLKLKYATEKSGDDLDRKLESFIQFEPDPRFNIWSGRILLPSARANLSGVYNLNTWVFPYASAYPSIFYGRDNGSTIWGQFNEGAFKYHLAATEGRNGGRPGENPDKLISSRLVLNFWDPEPGYFNKSSYYGEKDILALGLTYEYQQNAAGDGVTSRDFTGWSIDLMIEKKLTSGAVAGLESAYYNYDIGHATDSYFKEGDSFYSTASYMFAGNLGPGRLQPHVRYIQFDYTGRGLSRSWDVGANYIIRGHALRASLVYRTQQLAGSNQRDDSVILGLQGRF